MKTQLLAIAICTIGLLSCSNHTESKVSKANAPTDSTKAHEPAYVCTMGKECGSGDQPGKCPSCGNEMVANKH